MKTYSVVKRVYGEEVNQVNPKNYEKAEDAFNAGNSWLRDCRVHAEIRKGWNFEVIENTENSFKFTGIAKSN